MRTVKIKIEAYKSSYRLRFTYPKGNRNTITVAPATKAGLVKAQQVAQLIELEILNGSFNIDKHRFSTEEITIISLWEQYKRINQNVSSLTTQLEPWKQTDRCLNKLPKRLIYLEKIM